MLVFELGHFLGCRPVWDNPPGTGGRVHCTVELNGRCAVGSAYNKRDAKRACALKLLEDNDALFRSMIDNRSSGKPYVSWARDWLKRKGAVVVQGATPSDLKRLGSCVAVDSEGIDPISGMPYLVQMATGYTVLLFDWSRHAPGIKAFLASRSEVILCDAQCDLTRMQLQLPPTVRVTDVQQGKLGLKRMVGDRVGVKLTKPDDSFYGNSNWYVATMDPDHVAYAAADAIATYILRQVQARC